MRVVTRQDILAHFDRHAVLDAIEDGFKAFARDQAQVAPVIHLAFPAAAGECHVKAAHVEGDEVFTVKLATGFYDNPAQGLPSSNGFMAVVSAATGEPRAILQDEGALTDLRTALAGVIATRLGGRRGARTLGIFGSGVQARLQAEFICELLGYDSLVLWARASEKAAALADTLRVSLPDLEISTAPTPADLCARADTIITATAARAAIVRADWVRPGTHITAVGADSPGKQELDPALFARARHVIVDSVTQCTAHGETSHAVGAGIISRDALLPLGVALSQAPLARAEDDITIADLTGVAVQDAAIARCVWHRLDT